MATTAEKGEQVRHRLRRAAVELIAERGWRAVTTRAVAERAGVGQGLVHYHFTSVEALLREAALGLMRAVVEQAAEPMDRAAGADEGMRLLLGALDAHTGTDPASLVFLETYLAAGRDAALGGEVRGIVVAFRERTTRWLERCGTAEPERTAAVLAAAVDGLLLHRGLDPSLTGGSARPVLERLLGGRR
ncbi:TetR/AcrR family transcriptional regulator [Pseudonocardia humida]|uniref:TetR/AcrR family transcriptional regulator n=1 Tax=Pseudonocardia humida TaxID=2800819 RepID=A0ABT0ZY02_9PSEU|nr:TetR/AcrR family transcriptional regulator [Pseudonocardia humida]MCO1655529.1 TetR/AcrR family transcriptional regulator [Pseudonocardia humida]